ncbi:MAG: endonuclease III domain-containing protein [Bacillota bacterium]
MIEVYPCRQQYERLVFNGASGKIYRRLLASFGSQEWWPAESRFEVIVGAILTQAVSWHNVSLAIDNLREADLLSPRAMIEVSGDRLACLIKPAGYYNVKARKLKAFVNFLEENYQGGLACMFDQELTDLRPELLGVYGIGPETADSILLYAGGFPVFVIDAYTRRIFCRLGYIDEGIDYEELQIKFHRALPEDADLFNEYHALLVRLGKENCQKNRRA